MTRVVVSLLCLAFLAAPLAAEAQAVDKLHRIGVIVPGGPRTTAFDLLIREMTEQLRARGWVEGQNIALEYRFDEGKRERPFAAVRLRTAAAKRYKKVENATAVIWKTLLIAERTFRRLDAPELLAEVAEGVTYINGERVKPSQSTAERKAAA
jgi:hypothetical protein